MKVNLKTDRLLIREYVESDFDAYHSLLTDEEAMHYLPEIRSGSLEESRQLMNEILAQANREHGREKYFLAIDDEQTGEYVGGIGYTVHCEDTDKQKLVHLGYFINKKFWNQGITTEAAQALIRWAFKEGDVLKIESGCLAENRGSERVLQKCGFRKESEKRFHTWRNGVWHTRVEYGLVRSEYMVCLA